MKLRTYFLLFFLLLVAGSVSAQNVPSNRQQKQQKKHQQGPIYTPEPGDEVKVPKKKFRNKKDHARFGIKVYYNSPELNVIDEIRSDYNNSGYVDIIRKSTFGPSLRIPIGRIFYLQTEALFGFNSDWEGAKEKIDFLDQLSYCYSSRTNSYMRVTIYVGARWAPITIFSVRGFVGPRFDFMINNGSFSYISDYYSFMAGAGIDLLRFFSFEMGYQIAMQHFSPIDGSGGWFVAASLMF